MEINKVGFYAPVFRQSPSEENIRKIMDCCPGIRVEGDGQKGVWGRVIQASETWSADPETRHRASSGGVVSALAAHMLDSGRVDAIMHVGLQEGSPILNRLQLSNSREEVLSRVGSRYAPALIFDRFREWMDQDERSYVFIGKPCDIACLKNIFKVYPEYCKRFKLLIAFFCAGIPSYLATEELVARSGVSEEPSHIKYRGDGWPGCFEVRYTNHEAFRMSYHESWGEVLGRKLGLRCKICPDGIGLLADVAVGDSWNTKDGFPDFEESDGKSFVLVRTQRGADIFADALAKGAIISQELAVDRISEMQNYQYHRRLVAGYRIFPIQMITLFMLKFKGLGLMSSMRKAKVLDGCNNFDGTLRRLLLNWWRSRGDA
ncbi:MAG: Coenzyme F420 hydrogenase/dehydrogenase, beta subunit C-terminal domain [Planctomycetes bacterium]|nr:Coenzyme F420 hydrogenase/dehydrogenase, beta subunit C-terminal domain [Planctomycetota bacterium]